MGKYILLFLSLILSCKSTKYTANQLPEKQVIIAESGGFTGGETSYILCSSGQVFKSSFPGNKTEEVKDLNTKKLKALYNKAWKEDWEKYSYSKPGNMSHHISFKNADKINKISWGSADTLVAKDLRDFYLEFNQIVHSKSKE